MVVARSKFFSRGSLWRVAASRILATSSGVGKRGFSFDKGGADLRGSVAGEAIGGVLDVVGLSERDGVAKRWR